MAGICGQEIKLADQERIIKDVFDFKRVEPSAKEQHIKKGEYLEFTNTDTEHSVASEIK